MLRIKKSEVLLSAIHGVGSVALVLFILKLAVPLAFLGPIGLQILAYVGGAIMMGLGVWILIRIQTPNPIIIAPPT